MQIIPLNLDSVLLFLHNSKLAYKYLWQQCNVCKFYVCCVIYVHTLLILILYPKGF